jgi:hypothetical protein
VYNKDIINVSMQKFCHNCGKQLMVGAKFCSSCGVSLSSLSNTPSAPTNPSTVVLAGNNQRPAQFTPFSVGRDDEDEDDSYIDKIEHLDIRQNELHVEIVRDRPLGESIGSLITQVAAPSNESRPALPNASDNKAFLQEFQKEAGTSRNEKQRSAA